MNPDIERRRRVMGSGMRLSYQHPLHIASASGVWMTDVDGIEYLDAYNNVPHVGHGRPEVAAAIARQTARLNTNTRYLVDVVVDYAERLAGLFPDPLDVVMFTTSGSEANDLAWRIARTVTGHDRAVVTHNAYHGATSATIETSPEERRRFRHEPTDVFRVPTAFADTSLQDIIDGLASPLAFLAVDTIFSSDGIHVPPSGALARIADDARAAGGLFIADEVQAGFGRIGTSMWGSALHGVVPDIVTLGKPMGNGYPTAAVVTTPKIAETFWERDYFFSTFAGNPVGAAAGAAVLDVMEAEALPSRADEIGALLRAEIRSLGHDCIEEVRGAGMFTGVEIADGNDSTGSERAAGIVEGMRDLRVLIGRTGPDRNVLKIRPPLVFDSDHVGLLIDALDTVLANA